MSIRTLPDPNFKYAIVAVLSKQQGLFIEEAERIKRAKSYSREYKNAPFHSFISEVVEYYINLEISDEIVATIKEFNPRGIERCYSLLLKEWDGEDQTFHINSLEGIEKLKTMEVFSPDHFLKQTCDLAPLLRCTSLKKVRRDLLPATKANEAVCELLRQKGVEIIG